jgi:hypothetical protein
MLMSDDYREMADRSAQLAIACSEPSVSKSLLALALDYMLLSTTLGQPAGQRPQMQQHDPAAGFGDWAVAFPLLEPDSDPMIESIVAQYGAQAVRYHALAAQADCPARQNLYRRLERGYLTLADLARPPSDHCIPGVRHHPHANPTASHISDAD